MDDIELYQRFDRLSGRIDTLFDQNRHLDELYSTLERLLAQMVVGYTEMWGAIETILSDIAKDRTPEEQEAFRKNFEEFRRQLFVTLQGKMKDDAHNVAGVSPDLAQSLEQLVERDNPESSS